MRTMIRDSEGTRVGVLDEFDGKVFLWIGRDKDTGDDERVAILNREQVKKLIAALVKEL